VNSLLCLRVGLHWSPYRLLLSVLSPAFCISHRLLLSVLQPAFCISHRLLLSVLQPAFCISHRLLLSVLQPAFCISLIPLAAATVVQWKAGALCVSTQAALS